MKLLFLIISALFILSCDEDNPLAPEVRGCTDETACNYDPLANIDNSSCEYLDNCGTCDNDSTNDCIPDCTGVWGGSAVEDNCGICNGDGSTCIDCNGVFAGGASLDNCDICDNDPTNDCVADCAGVWGGSAIEDNCGVCEGGNACLGNALAIANLLLENTLVNLYQQLGNPSYGDSGYWDWYYGNNNNDIEHPSQIDFTDAYNSYMYALSIDSDDPNANFGAALTSFLMITQDPILWEVIDEWENYNGWLIPADDGMGRASTASLIGSGIPMRSEDILSVRNFNILNYIPIGSSFEIMNGDEDDFFSSFPSIAQFQDMIDDVFIARLSQSIGYLENVVGKEYEFMITPQMQSDPYQSPIELDDAEFYALKSSIHILRAILYAINTYDFEFDPASEYSGDFSWMEPGSSFLTIRDGASNHLPSVHDDLNGIVNSLQQVYEFVQTETDYQGDDLILWQELNDTDASDVLYNELPDAINNDYLTEICTGYYDYNYWNYIEDCTDVTINISSFLNNPPSDLKEMIPDYYIETEINNDMWNNWEWVSGFSYQNITIPDCYDINNEGDCISQNGCTYDSMYNLCLNSFLSYPGDWWSFDMECSIDIVFNPGYVEPYIGYGDTCNELGQDFDDFVNEVVSNYLLLPLDDNANINLSITYFNYDNWETTEFCCSDDDSDICEDHYVEYNYDGNNFQCGVDNIHIEAEIEGMTEFEPCLVYDAAAYGNWVNEWDITFNGLFPYINQSTFINDILNIDQEEWEENQNCD